MVQFQNRVDRALVQISSEPIHVGGVAAPLIGRAVPAPSPS